MSGQVPLGGEWFLLGKEASATRLELLELEALNTAATPAAGVVVAAGGRDLLVPPHRALLAQLFRRHCLNSITQYLYLNEEERSVHHQHRHEQRPLDDCRRVYRCLDSAQQDNLGESNP